MICHTLDRIDIACLCTKLDDFRFSRSSNVNGAPNMHHSSTSTYVPNFIEIEERFCGRTDGRTEYRRTYERADGHLRPTLLARLGGVDLKGECNSIHHCGTDRIWKENIDCYVLKGLKRHFPHFNFFSNYVPTPNYPSLIKFSEHIFTCKELFCSFNFYSQRT